MTDIPDHRTHRNSCNTACGDASSHAHAGNHGADADSPTGCALSRRAKQSLSISDAPESGPLSAREVHVWYVLSDDVSNARVLSRYAAMMSPEERARHDRFVFAKHRHQFVVTRGVVRTLLGRYLAIEPAACAFVANHYGRPAVVPGPSGRRVEFNVSHTNGLVACAIARVPEVGVDVEDIGRALPGCDIAARYFSATEARTLSDMPHAARTSRFFDYWTLKEAYIKARGMGLSLPLNGFSMHLDDGGPPRISFAATIDDDSSSWQFAQFDPTPTHRLAVAVRRHGPDLTIRVHEFDVTAA